MPKQILILLILFLGPLGALVEECSAGEWRLGHLNDTTSYYSSSNGGSERLGQYTGGSPIWVYLPAKNGFFSTPLPKPVNGQKLGWVPMSAVSLSRGGDDTPEIFREPQSIKENSGSFSWFSVIYEMGLVNPTEFQTAMGEPAVALTTNGWGGEFGHFFGRSFYTVLRGQSFYTTRAETLAPGHNYTISGLTLTLSLGLAIVRNDFAVVAIDVGAGGTNGLVSNELTASAIPPNGGGITTAGLISVPLVAHVLVLMRILGPLNIELRAGYQSLTLSNATIYVLTGGLTQASPSVSLSGVSASAGLSIHL